MLQSENIKQMKVKSFSSEQDPKRGISKYLLKASAISENFIQKRTKGIRSKHFAI